MPPAPRGLFHVKPVRAVGVGRVVAGPLRHVRRARAVLALHAEMGDVVRLGAYRAGSDPAVDEAILLAPRIEAVLRQDRDERTGLDETFALLRAAMEITDAA